METTRFGDSSKRAASLAKYQHGSNSKEPRVTETLETSMVGCIDYLYGYAVTLTGNREDVEDLVQETYARALQAANRLRSDSNIKRWLWIILRNVWLNQLRQRKFRSKTTELDANDRTDYLPADRSDDPDTQYERKWGQERLRRAILQLPKEFREIVVLRAFEELSYADIAGLLACPAGTVMSRLARARKKLRYLVEFGRSENLRRVTRPRLRLPPALGVEDVRDHPPGFDFDTPRGFGGLVRTCPPSELCRRASKTELFWRICHLNKEEEIMSAYLIVNIDVKDDTDYEEYKAKVPALVRKHGGEYLVRGGNFIVLEGDWKPNRLVLLRFPDIVAVQNLFNDPEYQPLKALRQRATESEIVGVEGT
jgi:RNA polymerase sigma-70 factor, ECF subfamily